jgi:hypothetical protein
MHASIAAPVAQRAAPASPQGEERLVLAAYWSLQLTFWGWHLWWQASDEVSLAHVPFGQAVTVWGGTCLTGLAATDILRRLARRQGWLDRPAAGLVLRLALGLAALTLVAAAVTAALSLATYGGPVTALGQVVRRGLPVSTQLVHQFLTLLRIHLVWIAVWFTVLAARRHLLRTPPSGHSEPRLALTAYWAAQLAVWGWHFWWQASGEVIFAQVPAGRAAIVWGGMCLTGIVMTDLLRRLSGRQGWLELPTPALLARLTLSLLALTLTSCAVIIALSLAMYGSPVTAMGQVVYRNLPLSTQVFDQLLNLFLWHLTWIAAFFTVMLMRRRYELELQRAFLSESLQATELRLLKSQLNPHFLFNALNGIRALIADEPAGAQEAVTRLARTLRYTLAPGRDELVTLARELELVEDYLALELLRLGPRLRIVRDIEPEAAGRRIPAMLLQVLVENAIKHGIAPLREGGTLGIAARVAGGELTIEVTNPRPAQAGGGTPEGVGLVNAARRLELLFGARAGVHLDLSDAVRAKAIARLPA